jgi:DnaK suppressor protein
MEDYSEIREQLKAELNQIFERDQELRAAMRQKDAAGNLSFEDLGTEGEFDDVLESLGERSRNELLDAWNALQRMDRGTYGLCSNCGKEIHLERLRALPSTEFCVECAVKLEKRPRR